MPDNLERSIVRFHIKDGEYPAGTGFLISERRILTCAHVITAALGWDPDETPQAGDRVHFDFPLLGLKDHTRQKISGGICFWLSPSGEDLAVIEIHGDLPLDARPAPLLDVGVEELAGHGFETYGFSEELAEDGGWAEGEIVGKTATGLVQLKKKSVTDYFIKQGFSGGPIWDMTLNGVVGMSTAILDSPDTSTAYMTPTQTLLSTWKEQIQPSLVIAITGEYGAVLRGYTQEILSGYFKYWDDFVSPTRQFAADLEILRPVGQIFQSQVYFPKLSVPPLEQNREMNRREEQEQKETEPLRGGQVLVLSSLAAICNAIFTASGRPFLLLKGDPGAGKTLSLRHFLAEQAVRLQDFSGAVPIYLPLNRFQGHPSLEEFILRTLRAEKDLPYHQRLADNLERIIKAHGVILLLDGVNEIPGSSIKRSLHKALLMKVSQFSDRYPGRVRGVLSSREGEFAQESGLPVIEINPFEELGIREAILLFAPDHASEILSLYRNEPILQALLTNPFRLKALCQTYQPGMSIPGTPGVLYRTFVEALVNREVARHPDPKSFDGWSDGLRGLAFAMSERNTLAISEEALRSLLTPAILAFGISTGLLLRSVNEYKFVHQQIQEYFSALHLAALAQHGEAEFQTLTALSRKRFWDETFFLLVDLLPDEGLERVLDALTIGDVFLAARCAGMVHARLPAKTRETLTSALEQLLVSSRDHHNDDILEKTLTALGETRTAEALAVLERNNREDELYRRAGADFVNAVAKIDTPDAVRWLTATLLEKTEAGERTDQEDFQVLTLALASMQTPAAREFLFGHIQHPQLYAAILSALDERHVPDFLPAYQELITGLGIGLKEELTGSGFKHLCSIAGQAELTELIPGLLPYAHQPAAARTLVRLNAGQNIIDDSTSMLRYCLHFMERQQDLAVFDVRLVEARHLMTWAHLQTYYGSQAADQYTQLLVHCVRSAATRSNLEQAAGILAMLDSHELPELLENKQAGESEGSHLRDKLRDVIRMLETPGSYGIHKKTLEKTAALICVEENKTAAPLSETHPRDAIRKILDDPSGLREKILKVIAQKDIRWRHYQRDYYDLLTYLNEEGVVPILVDDLFQASRSLYRDSEYTSRVVTTLIELGGKDPGKRAQIIQLMRPLLLHTDRRLQVSAVEILSGLTSNEHCGLLLQFLSDQTWEIAYTIADHFGGMDPRGEYAGRLEERLDSHVPGQKYFALLALGSLKQPAGIPAILGHWQDPFEFNERAAIWALSEIGLADSKVAAVIGEALSSESGWVRLEAARAAGLLGLKLQVPRLVDLLDDPDLRVVEQAAMALGNLKDPAAFPYLERALKSAPAPLQYYHERVWRVEDRLRSVLATACIACASGHADVDFDPRMDSDKPGIQQALLIGEMQRRVPAAGRRMQPARRVNPTLAIDSGLTDKALEHADPQIRSKALDLLRNRGAKTIPDEIRHDPNPSVSLHYFVTTGSKPDYEPFSGVPTYDLGIAAALKDIKPAAVLKIPNDWEGAHSESCWAALELAALFPDRYRVSELLGVLFDLAERTNLPVRSAILLARALDKKDLPRFMRNSRASRWYGKESSQTREALESLALRRTWSVVHDLVTYLDNRTVRSDGHAGFFLAALGVYQAADWVQNQMRSYDRNEVLELIIQTDLLGRTPTPVSEEVRARSNYQGKLDVVFANLCCESNDEDAVYAWGATVGYRYYEADDAWISRGLRKWGISAVQEMIKKQGRRDLDPVLEFSDILGGFKGRRDHYRKLFNESDHALVFQLVDAEPEDYFLTWISGDSVGLQVLGLAALLRKKSGLLEDGMNDLLSSLASPSVLFLFEAAHAGRLPRLMDSILALQDPARPGESFLVGYLAGRIQDEPSPESIQFIELIGKFKLQALAKQLAARLAACDGSNEDYIKAIMMALHRLEHAESAQQIQIHLEAGHPRLAPAALEALLAMRAPLPYAVLEKLLLVDNTEVRGLVYLLCASRGREQLAGRIHEQYLAMLKVQELASDKDSEITSDQLQIEGLPSLQIQPGSNQRQLDELIDTASLSLYLLGRLDTFKFPYQIDGHAGTGLLAFYFITMIFSAEYHYGNWRNTSLQAGWLRIFPLGDVLKFIELDLDRAPWLTQADKDFLLGLTANALPELTDSIQQAPDQMDLRLRRQASLNNFLTGQGYSVADRAKFIELTAERAMAEALQLLRDLSGLEDPAAQVTAWKAEMQGIESEEQFRKIGWQWVEHGCFLWALDRLGKVPIESELIDSMDSFAAYAVLGGEAERNHDEFMADLFSSHKTRLLELRQGLFRIMNLCETRDMIYLLGMDIMNVFDSSREDSEAGIWIKKWRLIPLTMRNEALRKSRKKMDDGQKENPYELALEEKRRRVHSGI